LGIERRPDLFELNEDIIEDVTLRLIRLRRPVTTAGLTRLLMSSCTSRGSGTDRNCISTPEPPAVETSTFPYPNCEPKNPWL
jgi:hypothetical protein